MTGYGKAECSYENKKIHAEIKSLNSKNLDINARIAPFYREKEMEIRQMISQRIVRGKVEFNLWIEKDDGAAATIINKEVVANYVEQIRKICEEQSLEEPQNWWEIVMRLPESTQVSTTEELSKEEWGIVHSMIEDAMAQLIEFRKQEGVALEKKFNEKIDNISNLLASIEQYEHERVEKIRQRLEENLSELKNIDYDRGRLEQELIYYIEKLDISEEKQRLTNHLTYFRNTMLNEHAQGKKLGFIAQEMGREINTTGSKSNQAEMQNIVVKMKDELEQIKEQVFNVL